MSSLARALQAGELDRRYWIAGDDAYSASAEQVVTPYPGKNLQDRKDNFNFYLSSSRIVVECCFGMLVARWGILWRRLDCHLSNTGRIVRAVIALHNFCIAKKCPLTHAIGSGRDDDMRGEHMHPITTTYAAAGRVFHPRRGVGRGRGQQNQRGRRDHLAAAIEEAGLVRPAL